MTKAIIFGVTGQDGSYLSELLLEKGYEVYGVIRRSSINTKERISHILDHENFYTIEGDVTDPSSVCDIIGNIKADECYNLAAMSHVGTSFKQPTAVFHIDAIGPLNCLEAIRTLSPQTKFYQASSSEMFGSNLGTLHSKDSSGGLGNAHYMQNETTQLTPNSPYAVAKTAAHHLVRAYRQSYGLFACAGILLNHESERRGEEFVTRKITKWLAEFKSWKDKHPYRQLVFDNEEVYLGERVDKSQGFQFPKLRLGNLEARRDWGHAEDYCKAMFMMMQTENPIDYLVATGEAHSVKDFCRLAFKHIGIDNWEGYIYIDPELFRPCEVPYLCGNAGKIQKELGWKPEVTFEELVRRMVESDMANAKKKT